MLPPGLFTIWDLFHRPIENKEDLVNRQPSQSKAERGKGGMRRREREEGLKLLARNMPSQGHLSFKNKEVRLRQRGAECGRSSCWPESGKAQAVAIGEGFGADMHTRTGTRACPLTHPPTHPPTRRTER